MLDPQLAFLFGTSGQVDKVLDSYLFVFSSTSIALVFADNTAEDGTFHNGIRKVWFLLDMTKVQQD